MAQSKGHTPADIFKIEESFGLRFEQPDSKFIEDLQLKVDKIAKSLGKSPFKLQVPERGLLTQSITTEQRKVFDEILGPMYAKSKVKAQNLLRSVPIVESGERMLSIKETLDKEGLVATYSATPFHQACGDWAGKPRVFWLREQVMGKVIEASRALGEVGICLHFEDAFRPEGVQEGLFKRRFEWVMKDHPSWELEKVYEESRSKTTIAPYLAGHKGGASIDVTLRDQNGEQLPLGNQYPEGGMLVFLDCPYLTKEEWATRQLFRAPFYLLDFYVNPAEDWHVDFGGLNHPTASENNEGYNAIYGPIKGFNQKTGEIFPYDTSDYYKDFYSMGQLEEWMKN
jgi:D-alanyl-D-alanine dipeptidase